MFSTQMYPSLCRFYFRCWTIIDEGAEELLRADLFTSIGHDLLTQLISRDTFLAKETSILKGVLSWATAECQRLKF